MQPLTLDSLITHWGDVYIVCYHRDRWVALRRDNESVLAARTLAGLQAEIEDDYRSNPMPRKSWPRSITDYLDPGEAKGLGDGGDAAVVWHIILRALGSLFPSWVITYSSHGKVWIARRDVMTIYENSPELLVVALTMIAEKYRPGWDEDGRRPVCPWPVIYLPPAPRIWPE